MAPLAWLSPRGRLGTGGIILALIRTFGLFCLVELFAALMPMVRCLHILLAWSVLCAGIRRAHDIGRTFIIPVTAFILFNTGAVLAILGGAACGVRKRSGAPADVRLLMRPAGNRHGSVAHLRNRTG